MASVVTLVYQVTQARLQHLVTAVYQALVVIRVYPVYLVIVVYRAILEQQDKPQHRGIPAYLVTVV